MNRSDKKRASFDDFLNSGTEKVASVHQGDDLLKRLTAAIYDEEGAEKVAAEDKSQDENNAAAKAPASPPKSENHKSEVGMADGNALTGASSEVSAAMESVETPAVAAAGADVLQVEAGHQPKPTVRSDEKTKGTGIPTDAKLKKGEGKTDSAVTPAAVSEAGALTDEQTKEAALLGEVICNNFMRALEKRAQAELYSESIGILKEAGFLEGYAINVDPMEKSAGVSEGCLEKLASGTESLTQGEVIGAAQEYLGFVKQASDVEEMARNDAREHYAAIVQQEQEKNAGYLSEDEADALVKQAMSNPEIVRSVKTLQEHGILNLLS